MITTAMSLLLATLSAFIGLVVFAQHHELVKLRKGATNESQLREQLTRAITFRDHWNAQALATLAELKAEQTRHANDIERQAQQVSALLEQRNALGVQLANMTRELDTAREYERNTRAKFAHLQADNAFTLAELDEMKRTRALFSVIDELAK